MPKKHFTNYSTNNQSLVLVSCDLHRSTFFAIEYCVLTYDKGNEWLNLQ